MLHPQEACRGLALATQAWEVHRTDKRAVTRVQPWPVLRACTAVLAWFVRGSAAGCVGSAQDAQVQWQGGSTLNRPVCARCRAVTFERGSQVRSGSSSAW